MISRGALNSASGLRPVSAFVVIAAVLLAVAGKALYGATLGPDAKQRAPRVEHDPAPTYAMEDAAGRPLAVFEKDFALEMSPNAMWRAHTPERIAAGIAAQTALGGGEPIEAQQVLARMLPGLRDGVLRSAVTLDDAQARRLTSWAAKAGLSGIRADREGARQVLAWRPAELLSAATRASQERSILGEESQREVSAALWNRWLLDRLLEVLVPEQASAARANFGSLPSEWRDELWNALLPAKSWRALEGLTPQAARGMEAFLRAEGVNGLQMRVVADRERLYPCGKFPVLGSWGWTGVVKLDVSPRTGLELYCDELLFEPEFAWLRDERETYRYRANRAVHEEARPYYLESLEGAPAPVVELTLDASLQRFLHERLGACLEEHKAALAMGIAIDVRSAEVLAVDHVSRYGLAEFLPLTYRFTPGSTFKVITMATALEQGVVEPEDRFDVGHKDYVHRVGKRSRAIHEADGSLAVGSVSAAQCLAYSSNAGMVQIGALIPADSFQEKVRELGYGSKPAAGLGLESAGSVTAKAPWDRLYTQASVSFGHEIEVSLWQHATALLSVLRAGELQPLRLVRAVRQGDRRVELPAPESRRVFSERTAEQVRSMLQLGALEGTGRSVCKDAVGMLLGTKTGSAEKTAHELCQHAYGRALQASHGQLTSAAYRATSGQRPHPISCRTCSMAIFGRLEGSEREVFVLIVVDEPAGKQRYGSMVAGPTALQVLEEALGRRSLGELTEASAFGVFAVSDLDERSEELEPWNRGAELDG